MEIGQTSIQKRLFPLNFAVKQQKDLIVKSFWKIGKKFKIIFHFPYWVSYECIGPDLENGSSGPNYERIQKRKSFIF